MKSWTQAELDDSISCPKQIVDPPRKEMRSERGHQRNDMTLSSLDGERRFSAFLRVNERFPENFSIGLVYHPRDEPGALTLLRRNGPHGEHVNEPEDPHPHFGYHVHRANAEAINAGLSPEKQAAPTDAYASFPEALQYFLKAVSITGAEAYFPASPQLPLFPGEEGE